MSLWATKPISVLRAEADQAGEHSLQRALGPLNLVTLGIGAIIGAGIFVLTGQAAALHAGPAVWISMILVGVACAFAGLCYAEMASAVPVAGSAYTYAYATMGELVAWVIGWDLVLEYAAGAATVGVGWSGHLVSLLASARHRPARQPDQRPDPVVHRRPRSAAAAGCAHAGLNMTGAARQPARGLHRRGDEHHPGDRHQGVGQGQQPDRHPQGGDRAAHRRRRPRPTSTPTTGRR